MKKPLQAIVHASELLTGAGLRKKDGRRVSEEDLGRIPDGAMVFGDRIEWVGKTCDLPKKWSRIKRLDLKGKKSLMPGLVDCHNHLIFSGDRSDEFAERCGGATYDEIAAKGGGILKTVQATRYASSKDLERIAIPRLKELFSRGVRTVEIKSGYGLSHESELKILSVIPALRKRFPEMTLTATYLGAHAIPKGRDRKEYIREMIEVTIPEVSKKRLADSCDVFMDAGYYTAEEGREILRAAERHGLRVKVHADELANTESASLAVELEALSADHLLKISEKGIKDLAQSSMTVAVLLPGTAFYLKAAQAPARKLLDAGACVALATDFNPGTSVCLSLPAVMTIAALYLGMTRAEIFAAVTYCGAKALGLEAKRGTLEVGMEAAYWVIPFARFDEVYYRFAW